MLAAAPASRRERKKLATRQALHQATMDLTEERGLAHVTVEAVAERADVAVRTFSNHFSSKEEAILEPEPDRTARLCRALAARPGDEAPLVALRRTLVDDLVRRDVDPADMARRIRLARAEPALMACIAARFDEVHDGLVAVVARRRGVDPAADPYPDLVVAIALAAAKVSVRRWCQAGGTGDVGAVLDAAFTTLAGGLVQA